MNTLRQVLNKFNNLHTGININTLRELQKKEGVRNHDTHITNPIYIGRMVIINPNDLSDGHVGPIKIGIAKSLSNRIRKFNQPGGDFRLLVRIDNPSYEQAKKIEEWINKWHPHRKVNNGKGQRELYDFELSEIKDLVMRIQIYCALNDMPIKVTNFA